MSNGAMCSVEDGDMGTLMYKQIICDHTGVE